jgi:hypothetical protein
MEGIEMKSIIPIILILTSTQVFAFDNWNTEEKLFWGFKTVGMYIDYEQTKYISDHPDEYHEKYGVFWLGKHPSKDKVTLVFAGSYIIQTGIVHILPRDADVFGYKIKPRRIFQSFSVGVTSFNVGNNFRIGIGFSKMF